MKYKIDVSSHRNNKKGHKILIWNARESERSDSDWGKEKQEEQQQQQQYKEQDEEISGDLAEEEKKRLKRNCGTSVKNADQLQGSR